MKYAENISEEIISMKEKLSEKIFAQLRGDIIAGKYTARDFISESEIEQGTCEGCPAPAGGSGVFG